MYTLVLIRHGQSWSNRKGVFTGWDDPDLSPDGFDEANEAGDLLNQHKFKFDVAYTSVLKRAIRTLWIVLDKTDMMWIPIYCSWRLNERHYGAVQGKIKEEYRDNQTGKLPPWHRDYSSKPDNITEEGFEKIANDPRYAGIKEKGAIPWVESLKDTKNRMLPYWRGPISRSIKNKKKVLIVAHGNTLRGLVMHLGRIPETEIAKVEIPTGIPLICELNEKLKAKSYKYLGSKSEVPLIYPPPIPSPNRI